MGHFQASANGFLCKDIMTGDDTGKFKITDYEAGALCGLL
jgi:hypothetical protein